MRRQAPTKTHTNPQFLGGSDEEAAVASWPRQELVKGIASIMAPSTTVLPLLDIHRSVVELRLERTWRSFHIEDAQALGAALSNAVSTPRWEAATSTLTVRVPVRGNASGRALFFSLIEFSLPLPNARLRG